MNRMLTHLTESLQSYRNVLQKTIIKLEKELFLDVNMFRKILEDHFDLPEPINTGHLADTFISFSE